MREIVYPPVNGAVLGLFRLLDLRFTVEGREHIPRTGPAVLAANHVSYLDFVFVGLAARPRLVRFMAKKEIFDRPVAGRLMRNMRHISVDRTAGGGSYAEALASLNRNEMVGLFPEATISLSFQLKSFKQGAARLAINSQAPLVPVVTWGGQRLFTKDRKPNYRRHTPITIAVGEPLHPTADDDATAVTAELYRRLSDLLAGVQDGYPDQASGPDDRWWLPETVGGTAPSLERAAEIEVERRRRARDKVRRRMG